MSKNSAHEAPNVARLLLRRELGAERPGICVKGWEHGAMAHQLESWREEDFLQNCSAEYACFQPAPRSTIALCYNCDGSLLASTHGDHTVKLTSCHSGTLSRVLTGHRRTPWVVRFHPRNPMLLASGSLDHEVRLWDAATGQCIAKHTFGKPIASLAFHVSADVLAIACGHKLHMWEYKVAGATPVIVLKTRRSMRAVHFHPHGLPIVLTAEVQDPSPTYQLPETLTEERAFISPHLMVEHAAELAYPAHPLPPSMVPTGREVPFPAYVPAALPTAVPGSPSAAVGGGVGNGGDEMAAARLNAAYNAQYAMWNGLYSEEQPPRVRLRLWNFDSNKPAAEFREQYGLRLELTDAVLCSEMGVHFSPCGKYLAATMACKGPFPEAPGIGLVAGGGGGGAAADDMDWAPSQQPDPASFVAPRLQIPEGEPSTPPHRPPPADTNAPRHPAPQRVVFEVRVMSMDSNSYGEVVRARRVRAAHCLTSVQFSPTGDHVLLAYGKKHSSLLRSLVMDGGALVPLHTILEVLAVKDMSLVRVLPSVEDEINAACFHPVPGCGLAYGTKEGRLRVVTANRVEVDGGEGDGGGGAVLEGGGEVSDGVLVEQSYLLLQQQWERDNELRERMRRDQRNATRAAAQGLTGSQA